jgi:hypothetical protein
MKEALANDIQKHECNCSEALCLICLGAFAHNSKNVVGGPLAAWLVQHDKRFFSSHEDIYVPLSDLHRCLTNEKIDSQVQYTSNSDNYLENQALHYLCHHDELEDYSVFDFYQEYKRNSFTCHLVLTFG